MARSTIFRISSFLILSVVVSIFAWKYFSRAEKVVVATVGPYVITEDQVQYQMQVNSILNPQPTDRDVALRQVKEINAYDLLMQKYGWKVEMQDLINERERIHKNTRARNALEKIHAIDGYDRDYYLKIFVRGALLRRQIYKDFYFSTEELHQQTKDKALKLITEMQGQPREQIQARAHQDNLPVFDFAIEESDGLRLEQLRKPEPSNGLADVVREPIPREQRQRFASEWIEQHKNFQIINGSIFFNEGDKWAVLFPEKWNPRKQHIKGLLVMIPKRPFQSWLKEELPKVEKLAGGEAL